MPIRYEHSITIARPVHEVFAFFSDPRNATKWQSGLRRIDSEGPVRVGSRWRELRRFLGRDIETSVEVTALEPDRRFAVRAAAGRARFAFAWEVEPDGGGTRFIFAGQADAGGLLRLGGRFVARAAKRQVQADLAGAKRLLEAS